MVCSKLLGVEIVKLLFCCINKMAKSHLPFHALFVICIHILVYAGLNHCKLTGTFEIGICMID